jgi:predicted nucleotidyltransferase
MTDCKQFDDVQEIVKYLEKEYGITVLSIRDYGSRAWNLDSETSDMDAGMVFRQEPLDYITLGGHTQNIDRKFMLDGEEFELIGWNIDRFAELLNKSNPSMIEWLNSDICYYESYIKKGSTRITKLEESKSLFNEIKEHANENLKPIALWGHYRDMGKANYRKYIENRNDLSVKQHLYILRGLTYARYVLETHRRPTLDFPKFYSEQLPEIGVDQEIYNWIGELIERKKKGKGDQEIGDPELWSWMEKELAKEPDHSKHDVNGVSREKINDFIKRVVP